MYVLHLEFWWLMPRSVVLLEGFWFSSADTGKQLFDKDEEENKTKTGEGKNLSDELNANEIQLRKEKKEKKKENCGTSELK